MDKILPKEVDSRTFIEREPATRVRFGSPARATGHIEASTKFLLAWGRGTLTIQDKDGTLAIIKVSVE
jgi:hypothetical protein